MYILNNKILKNNGKILKEKWSESSFNITVDTTQTGVSNNDQFQFTGAMGEYDVLAFQNETEVASFNNLVDETTITLPSSGTYQLKVFPKEVNGFHKIAFNNGGDKLKLMSLDNWGDIVWSNCNSMFYGCQNMVGTYTDNPNASNVISMYSMFRNAFLFNSPLNFDTSNVTSMDRMFLRATSFNQPLNFDTSNVTSMFGMFFEASAFNQPLNFDTSNVTSMDSMFSRATSFNQPLNFDTSNVTSMIDMFRGASSFNQPLNFDTSNVTIMFGMFRDASLFNQPLNFDTSNVTSMTNMFLRATSFNQPLNFDTSNVTSMINMFRGASSFKQSLANFNIENVIDLTFILTGTDINETGTTTNYDETLNSFSNQNVNPGLSFLGGNAEYSTVGQVGRNDLINNDNWTISDGGLI